MRRFLRLLLLLVSAGLLVGTGIMVTTSLQRRATVEDLEAKLTAVQDSIKEYVGLGEAAAKDRAQELREAAAKETARRPDILGSSDVDLHVRKRPSAEASEAKPPTTAVWPNTPVDASTEQRMLDKQHILNEEELRKQLAAQEHEARMRELDLKQQLELARYEMYKSVLISVVPALLGFLGAAIGFKTKPA